MLATDSLNLRVSKGLGCILKCQKSNQSELKKKTKKSVCVEFQRYA